MTGRAALPAQIGSIHVPQDRVSAATWSWALRSLPEYLFDHSVRSYCWGATLAADERLAFEPPILWAASLLHDVGLTRIGRNRQCFEFAGAAFAERLLVRMGMAAPDAGRVRVAIELHMAPAVTLADGAESVLLDRSTGIDVRGVAFNLIERTRPGVIEAFPRGKFDRHFLAAIRREVAMRPGCQSERLLHGVGLEASMASSPWAMAPYRAT